MLNTMVMFFPHIMYGLPLEAKYKPIKVDGSSDRAIAEIESIEVPIAIPLQENLTLVSEDNIIEKKKDPELFSPEYIESIEAKLKESISLKLYLQEDFSLSQISFTCQIPAHHLTYFFSNIKKDSFSDWRNQLRVEEAIRLMNHEKSNQFTLESIGLKVGFKSNSTFIRSFKKYSEKTPSEYYLSINS